MHRSSTHGLRIVLSVVFALGAPLQAQSVTRPRTLSPSQDSLITRLISTTLIARLAGSIADAGVRDTALPWVIDVPRDSGAVRWSVVASVLRRPLFARARLPVDRAFHVVAVQSYRFTRDSVTFEFFIGSQQACGAKFTGGGTGYRAAMAWPAYPSPYVPIPSIETEFSSSGPCQTP